MGPSDKEQAGKVNMEETKQPTEKLSAIEYLEGFQAAIAEDENLDTNRMLMVLEGISQLLKSKQGPTRTEEEPIVTAQKSEITEVTQTEQKTDPKGGLNIKNRVRIEDQAYQNWRLTHDQSIKQRNIPKKTPRYETDEESSSERATSDPFDVTNEHSSNRPKRKNKKRRERAERKYTFDGSSTAEEEIEEAESEVDQGGRKWLKRLVELEESGVEHTKAVSKIFIVLAGEMVEVMKSFRRSNIKAVKPLKYGKEKVQKFEAFIEDYERYAKEQLGKDKSRWAVELRNFLEGPVLRTYYSIYRAKVKYTTIVARLKSWCKEEKETEQIDLQLS